MGKSNVTRSLQGIWTSLHFDAIFSFSLSLSISKRSTLTKLWEGSFPVLRACRRYNIFSPASADDEIEEKIVPVAPQAVADMEKDWPTKARSRT